MFTDSLFGSALALPEQLRADLALRLLDSLGSDQDRLDWLSDEYAAEVQRRSTEMDSGEVEGVPWQEVRAAIDQRLNDDQR